MNAHGKSFWARRKRLYSEIASAKRDRDDFCRTLVCLRRRLPTDLSNRVVRVAV